MLMLMGFAISAASEISVSLSSLFSLFSIVFCGVQFLRGVVGTIFEGGVCTFFVVGTIFVVGTFFVVGTNF